MNPTKVIVISVIAYIALFFIAYFLFQNTRFSGDAAGSGLAKGLTFLYGLAFLFLLAVIVTIVLLVLYRSVTPFGVKLMAFIPIFLPLFIF
jgi:presenilin-like A22 family membrane protease